MRCEGCEIARERIVQLEEVLGQGRHLRALYRLGLTGAQAKVFSVILARGFVTKNQIHTVVYNDRAADEDIPDKKIIDVLVCLARKKLKPHGITIKTVWGSGFEIDAESAARAKALIAAEGAGI